jgi:hypothetical protein
MGEVRLQKGKHEVDLHDYEAPGCGEREHKSYRCWLCCGRVRLKVINVVQLGEASDNSSHLEVLEALANAVSTHLDLGRPVCQ